MSDLEQIEENSIKTSCRFCEFNQKDNDGNQTGCELNLLKRYEDKSVSIETVDFEDQYGKGTCKQIETFCLFRRPPGWKKAKQKDGVSFEDLAKEELIIDTTFVVYIAPEKTFEDVVNFVEHVNKMSLLPYKILFMNYAKISPLLFQRLNDQTKIEWGMEFMLNLESITDSDKLREKGNDLGARKTKTNFIVTLDVNTIPRPDLIEVIRNKLVNDLESIFLLIDDKGQPNFYQTILYKHVHGNEQASVNDKIQWIAEEKKCQHLIKKSSEIFQKLP